MYPFCFCQCNTRSDAHLYALEPGCNKALESLIDDSIYFYLCCVCTCNSILCVLPLIDIFNLCTNAKTRISLPRVMREDHVFPFCLVSARDQGWIAFIRNFLSDGVPFL